MRKPNLRIMGIEVSSQRLRKIFSAKLQKKTFPDIRKRAYKYTKKLLEYQLKWSREENVPITYHSKHKNLQNKEQISKAAKEKGLVSYKTELTKL